MNITERRDGDFMVNKTFQAIGEEMVTNWLAMVALCLLCLLLKDGMIAWAFIIPYCLYKHCVLSKRKRVVLSAMKNSEKFGVMGD